MKCGYQCRVSRFPVECFPAIALGADVSQRMSATRNVPSPRQRLGYVRVVTPLARLVSCDDDTAVNVRFLESIKEGSTRRLSNLAPSDAVSANALPRKG